MRTRIGLVIFLVWAVACTDDGDKTPPSTDTATSDSTEPTDTPAPSDSATPTDTPAPPDSATPTDATVVDATAEDVPAPDAVVVDATVPDAVIVDASGGAAALGGCCEPATGAEACEGGLICLEIPDGVPTCHQPAGNVICNVDTDCPGGFACKGAELCDCTVDCMTTMGSCDAVGFPDVCCTTQADCGEAGLMCVAGADGQGVCKPIPPPVYGPCWGDKACMNGDICVGAQLCPCNANCLVADQIGTCEEDPNASPCGEKPPVGCSPQEDCGEGNVCMFTNKCLPGSCFCNPDNGQWMCTKDCSPGECVPVEQACTTPNPAGCASNEECPSGQVCGPSSDGACISSSCFCSSEIGTMGPWNWACTEDCGGGVCQTP